MDARQAAKPHKTRSAYGKNTYRIWCTGRDRALSRADRARNHYCDFTGYRKAYGTMEAEDKPCPRCGNQVEALIR